MWPIVETLTDYDSDFINLLLLYKFLQMMTKDTRYSTKATSNDRLHKTVTRVPTFPTVPGREWSEEITVYFRSSAFLLH